MPSILFILILFYSKGSARFMAQTYQDAMTIVRHFGRPDIFLTYTCNPYWDEIQTALLPHQTYSDRPDIVDRVFHLKGKELIKDLIEKHVLGTPIAYLATVEFQKRGLPHMHILIILRDEDKFNDPRRIDNLISAEIPDRETNPLLYEYVSSFMVHGPHGPNSPCLENNNRNSHNCCSKNFPKEFSDYTHFTDSSYPIYFRPNNGRTVSKPSPIHRGQTVELDNRWVVPYCPKLLLKYKCHINVEICSSILAVKYLVKYHYKGWDVAQVNIVANNVELQTVNYDEITYYKSKN